LLGVPELDCSEIIACLSYCGYRQVGLSRDPRYSVGPCISFEKQDLVFFVYPVTCVLAYCVVDSLSYSCFPREGFVGRVDYGDFAFSVSSLVSGFIEERERSDIVREFVGGFPVLFCFLVNRRLLDCGLTYSVYTSGGPGDCASLHRCHVSSEDIILKVDGYRVSLLSDGPGVKLGVYSDWVLDVFDPGFDPFSVVGLADNMSDRIVASDRRLSNFDSYYSLYCQGCI